MSGVRTDRLCLPPDEWPDLDRELWRAAQRPGEFLEPSKPASRWSSRRRRIVEQTYGQWVGFLSRAGELDPTGSPGSRATEDRVRRFATELGERVAPASVGMMIGALLRMLAVLEPERDWTWMRRAYNTLKQSAVPTRNKGALVVPASALYELGVTLMATCEQTGHRVYRSTRFRDGLMIALLISCPVRIANFKSIIIGQHLKFDGRSYYLEFTGDETKTGNAYVADVPATLTPFVDQYLEIHRVVLLRQARGYGSSVIVPEALWVDRWGRPMTEHAVRDQIKSRTKRAFGHAIWPHLFRDCAVTELVDVAPAEIGIASDVLAHSSLQTTRKHYIQAHGMKAHRLFQEMIADRRRALGVR